VGLPDPSVLVGLGTVDDAAVVRLTDDVALVLTTDFFTPIVDDAYAFGQIAVANALSDVYAMGGVPRWALNLAAFPMKTLPLDMLVEILRGGSDKAAEAGVSIVGGHTVEDAEPKFGLAVVGTVHPDRVLRKGGGRPGDVLVLTKALGTGVVATGLKRGKAESAWVEAMTRSMLTLNRAGAEAAIVAGARAMTDITGYGLLGHLLEMCRAGAHGARLDADAVPLLPGALELARQDVVPGGTRANAEFTAPSVRSAARIEPARRVLLADAQTSGGLLAIVPAERAAGLVAAVPGACVIGEVLAGEPAIAVD
jgi:selenide,water dikinase